MCVYVCMYVYGRTANIILNIPNKYLLEYLVLTRTLNHNTIHLISVKLLKLIKNVLRNTMHGPRKTERSRNVEHLNL